MPPGDFGKAIIPQLFAAGNGDASIRQKWMNIDRSQQRR